MALSGSQSQPGFTNKADSDAIDDVDIDAVMVAFWTLPTINYFVNGNDFISVVLGALAFVCVRITQHCPPI